MPSSRMPSGKVIGGVAALVFAILAGVFAWLADRESGDTESKKYKGYYAGSIVTGLLFLVSLVYAIYSAFMDAPSVTEEAQPQSQQAAIDTAANVTSSAGAVLESPPDPSNVAKAALAGGEPGNLMAKAKEIEAAGQEATAQAKTGAETAATATLEANSAAAAAGNKATKAAVNAAATRAAAEQAEQTLAALSNASAKAKEVANQTRTNAVVTKVAAAAAEKAGEALAARGAKLKQVIPLAAAAAGS